MVGKPGRSGRKNNPETQEIVDKLKAGFDQAGIDGRADYHAQKRAMEKAKRTGFKAILRINSEKAKRGKK